ncbi:hypothetical protein DPQ33_10155 [Oceanidesulfovibrio indonesiensis]|uniref:Uncharacterized protein n=1 Tax=Oceanidesulfovibrio indonesiensis TaxID=54767 RepID=A0A7M3MEB5_9BACT|nr:hypothetical protein [Oceanidesulfovibrio indonesiensis]TVM17145.1 hypothetical protein DPQ33_10155 [Oceanidesulfovibrio indonesiensis]
MRIRGSGSGASGHGGPGGSDERRRAFRRKHRVGDRVRGVMVGWESPGLAWVEVSGVKLLAALDSGPELGARLAFLVKSLDPDIVLQELPTSGGGQGMLAESISGFWTARAEFEHILREFPLPEGIADMSKPRKCFRNHLFAHPALLAAWLRTQAMAETINAELVPGRDLMLSYRPELMPAAWDHELLANVHGSELAWAFTLPRWGHCQVRLLFHKPVAGARVFLERSEHAEPLKRILPRLVERAAAGRLAGVKELDRVDVLSVTPLPPGSGQLLSELFTGPVEGRPSTGFSLRV